MAGRRESPVKIMIDGMTHVQGYGLNQDKTACGLRLLDRSLEAIMRLWTDGQRCEVDCLACLATLAEFPR